jgi:formylglycine-generating enzyme
MGEKMRRHFTTTAAFTFTGLLCALSPSALATVTFDWVTVGNPGNAADPMNSSEFPGIGSVAYAYRIGKYEVTNAQYTEFLNAVDPAGTNTRALYNASMGSNANAGGINFVSGNTTGSKYVVQSGEGNHPVTFVSWYDAARMANWMHNGQGSGSTESGVYTLTGNTALSGGRSANATVFIPTENEWYKAAYHQPAPNGGDQDHYWEYPTSKNNGPTSDQPPGDPSVSNNAANYCYPDFTHQPEADSLATYNNGYAVTGSLDYSSSQNYLTDVGAYTDTHNFYGTFDQAGNVWEWSEPVSGAQVRARGGSWDFSYYSVFQLSSGNPLNLDTAGENSGVGFRLASVPEPSSSVLGIVLSRFMLARGRRKR